MYLRLPSCYEPFRLTNEENVVRLFFPPYPPANTLLGKSSLTQIIVLTPQNLHL